MQITYDTFIRNSKEVEDRIIQACEVSGRPSDSVRLLPVTKTFPYQAISYCDIKGYQSVGENRVQEVVEKRQGHEDSIRWELIGHLQSNKAKVAVQYFDVIQSVDSLKLAKKISAAAVQAEKEMSIYLQVNAGNDPAKHGFTINESESMAEQILTLPNLILEGLMTIAPLSDDSDTATRTFSNLRELRDQLQTRLGCELPELSMGMSGDLELAIAEGSTCVRVGSALFGKRS